MNGFHADASLEAQLFFSPDSGSTRRIALIASAFALSIFPLIPPEARRISLFFRGVSNEINCERAHLMIVFCDRAPPEALLYAAL